MGEVGIAGRLLQRPYAISGEIVRGHGIGSKYKAADFVAIGVGEFPVADHRIHGVGGRRRHSRARPGDVVLLCVDKPADTWRDLETRRALPITPAN